MHPDRINDFSHLFEVLRSGCPPHAGFALGFDRLIAVMHWRDSIRDVIAFPKNGKGEDMLVGSPSLADGGRMREYGWEPLSIYDSKKKKKASIER